MHVILQYLLELMAKGAGLPYSSTISQWVRSVLWMKGEYKLQTLPALDPCRQNGSIDLKLVLQRRLQTQAIRNRRLQKAEKGNLETGRAFQCP